MDSIEHIRWNDQPLCYIIRASFLPENTTFLTPPEFKQQVGFVVYPTGGEIKRHVHRPLERHLVGTSEVLVVKQGRCLIDIYNEERELVTTREMFPGDVMLMEPGDVHELFNPGEEAFELWVFKTNATDGDVVWD